MADTADEVTDDRLGLDPEFVARLIELFFYAPLGMVWDREQVIDQLTRRGRSQAQMAKLMVQLAAQQSPEQVERQVTAMLEGAVRPLAKPLSRLVIELGVAMGAPGGPTSEAIVVVTGEEAGRPVEDLPAEDLPIEDYDNLTAREILRRLPDLTTDERHRVEAHERAGRARKTVLGWFDRHG